MFFPLRLIKHSVYMQHYLLIIDAVKGIHVFPPVLLSCSRSPGCGDDETKYVLSLVPPFWIIPIIRQSCVDLYVHLPSCWLVAVFRLILIIIIITEFTTHCNFQHYPKCCRDLVISINS